MRLSYKINIFLFAILVSVVLAMIAMGTLVINSIVYDLNQRLLSNELEKIQQTINDDYAVLEKHGLTAVPAYVKKAQQEILTQIKQLSNTSNMQISIITADQTESGLLDGSLSSRFREMLSQQKKGAQSYELKGKTYFGVFDSFDPWDWTILVSLDEKILFAKRDEYVKSVSLMGLAIIFIALFIGFTFGSGLSKRIENILSSVNRIRAGDFSVRLVEVEKGDEIDGLQNGINTMALNLQQYQDHLEELVYARTKQLEHANKELEAFSYSVSHDLRTPLRGIDGFSHALLEDYAQVLDETGKDYLSRVRRAAQQMGGIIDAMLGLARVNQHPLQVKLVELDKLVEEILQHQQQMSPDRQVECIITQNIHVQGDEHLLRIVLENLLGNAWKYTANNDQACIEFGCEQRDDEMVYFVKDNGAGFNMKYADKLFGAFQRLHGTDFDGKGIGLATVQRCIRRMGGRVWGRGEENKGAEFFFTLSIPSANS